VFTKIEKHQRETGTSLGWRRLGEITKDGLEKFRLNIFAQTVR